MLGQVLSLALARVRALSLSLRASEGQRAAAPKSNAKSMHVSHRALRARARRLAAERKTLIPTGARLGGQSPTASHSALNFSCARKSPGREPSQIYDRGPEVGETKVP